MLQYIKLYGLQRTFTNYMKSLIEGNTKDCVVLQNILGWKHGLYIEEDLFNIEQWENHINYKYSDFKREDILKIIEHIEEHGVKYLVCIKNPFSWIYSYAIYVKKSISFDHVVGWMNQWNNINEQWIKELIIKKPMDAIVSTYEPMLKDTRRELRSIIHFFKLTKRSYGDEYFFNINTDMKKGGDLIHGSNKNISDDSFDRDVFLNRKYMSAFSNQMKNYILEKSSKKVCDFCVFKLEEYV